MSKKPVGLKIDEGVYARFKIICNILDKEVSETVEELMKQFIEQHKDLLKKPVEEVIG